MEVFKGWLSVVMLRNQPSPLPSQPRHEISDVSSNAFNPSPCTASANGGGGFKTLEWLWNLMEL